MLQALHQPKALRQQAARPREQHHNGQDSSGSKGFGSHSQHGGRWEGLVTNLLQRGSIKHTMHITSCMGSHQTVNVMAATCKEPYRWLICVMTFHSTPSEAATIRSAALAQGLPSAKGQQLSRKQHLLWSWCSLFLGRWGQAGLFEVGWAHMAC